MLIIVQSRDANHVWLGVPTSLQILCRGDSACIAILRLGTTFPLHNLCPDYSILTPSMRTDLMSSKTHFKLEKTKLIATM